MSIRLSHIDAGYPGKPVLVDYSLELPDTGVFALSGPSGIGKTTLLRLLASLHKQTAGQIHGLAGKQVSMVFQEDRLLPWRTVLENTVLPLAGEQAHLQAREWLAHMELHDWLHAYPGALSGGMQRRVAIARACAYGGDLLLLDEPFTGMDDALKARIAPFIKKAAPLIVMISHEQADTALMDAVRIHF